MPTERLPRFLKSLIQQTQSVRAMELSAQLAFYFLLSLFPFLIFVVSLLPMIGFNGQEFIELIRPFVPSEGMAIVDENLTAIFNSKKGGLLSFGIIATIWSASNAINGLMRALNHAYEITETRPFLIARLLAIILTIGMIVVIIVALILPVFGKVIGDFAYAYLGVGKQFLSVWEIVRWLLSFAIMLFVITFLYYIGPNTPLRFNEVIVGGVMATVGWLITSYGFSFYVSNFGSYTTTYGSLGGVIVLMLWFYVSAFILILGGVTNSIIHKKKRSTW